MKNYLSFATVLLLAALPCAQANMFTAPVAGLSIAKPPTVSAIAGVQIDNFTFPVNSPTGTVVGNLSARMNPAAPGFTGSWSLSGADAGSFQLANGNQLQVKAPAGGVPAHVQSCANSPRNTTGSNTISCTMPSGTIAGHLVTLFAGGIGTGASASATDEKGDKCVFVSLLQSGYQALDLYCPNVTAGANTFTVTFSGTPSYNVIAADEWSNIATASPLDRSAQQYQSSPGIGADAVSSGTTSTLAQSGELVVGGEIGGATTPSAGTGYTSAASVTSDGSHAGLSEYKVAPGTSPVAATFTINPNALTNTLVMTFKPGGTAALCPSGPCSYSINAVATQAGISNSPYMEPLTINTQQQISGIGLSRNSFSAGSPSGTVIGAVSVTMNPTSPAFGGSLSLSGTDAARFQIVGTSLETNGTPCPTGPATFSINVVATQSGVSNSSFSSPQTITCTSGTVMNHKGIDSYNPQIQFLSSTQLSALASRWQGIGVKWTRMSIDQATVNAACGDSFTFALFDPPVNAMAAQGIDTLLNLGGGAPCNSVNGGGTWTQPTNPANWAIFAGNVAQHYGAMGHHYYEIWNEENAYWDFGNGSCCAYPSVAAYTTLLCDAYTAIHANDSQATVIIGGAGPGAASYQGVWNGADWLTGIYNNGGANCFDADAGHPYMGNGPNGTLLGPNSVWLTYTSGPGNVYAVLQAHGQGNKPIWSTEIGCWQSPTDPQGECSQAAQAQFVTDLYNNPASRLPAEGPIFYWEDHDATGNTCATGQVTPSTYCAGIYNAGPDNYTPGTPKPAVAAYSAASGVW